MKDSRPTVALVAHGIHDTGGMERSLYELVVRSSERYRFVVLAAELDERIRPLVDWQRIAVPMRPIPLKLLAFAAAAGLRLRGVRADLVHTMGAIVPNHADLATVQFCFADVAGQSTPGGRPLRRANTALTWLLSRAWERWCYRPSRLRRLGAVSPGVARELRRHFPGIEVTVTPNGVDTQRFHPDPTTRAQLRAAEGVDEDDVVALFVGGDWERKGLAVAVDAAERAGVRLWVVGSGAAGALTSRARFFGVRADAERYYAAADVFVLPTLYETFSLAAYEAASSGLPIVATATHGIADLVGEDEAGILVERSVESVSAALARLAADPELRRTLGAEGRARVAAFGWERSVAEVESVYRTLLGGAA